MAKARAPKEQAKKGTNRDPATGYRVTTKKFVVYQAWKSKGSKEDGLKAALKFLGTHDKAAEQRTRGSVHAWFREFEKKFN